MDERHAGRSMPEIKPDWEERVAARMIVAILLILAVGYYLGL